MTCIQQLNDASLVLHMTLKLKAKELQQQAVQQNTQDASCDLL